jgi:hypothetical protein
MPCHISVRCFPEIFIWTHFLFYLDLIVHIENLDASLILLFLSGGTSTVEIIGFGAESISMGNNNFSDSAV